MSLRLDGDLSSGCEMSSHFSLHLRLSVSLYLLHLAILYSFQAFFTSLELALTASATLFQKSLTTRLLLSSVVLS